MVIDPDSRSLTSRRLGPSAVTWRSPVMSAGALGVHPSRRMKSDGPRGTVAGPSHDSAASPQMANPYALPTDQKVAHAAFRLYHCSHDGPPGRRSALDG